MATTQERHQYEGILLAMNILLHYLWDTIQAHQDCAGCDLCREVRGIYYSIAIFEGVLASLAPAGLVCDLCADIGPSTPWAARSATLLESALAGFRVAAQGYRDAYLAELAEIARQRSLTATDEELPDEEPVYVLTRQRAGA